MPPTLRGGTEYTRVGVGGTEYTGVGGVQSTPTWRRNGKTVIQEDTNPQVLLSEQDMHFAPVISLAPNVPLAMLTLLGGPLQKGKAWPCSNPSLLAALSPMDKWKGAVPRVRSAVVCCH